MRYAVLAILTALVACAPGAREGANAIVVGDAGASRIAVNDGLRADASEAAPFELALSERRACVRTSGRVHCTSDLHEGHAIASEPPLAGIDDAISVSLGAEFGCAATHAGKVFCFGNNDVGQLGAGLRADRSDAPVAVVGVSTAVRVVAGRSHACALLRDGAVRCWGDNHLGQTGSSTWYGPSAHELVEAETVPSVKEAVAIAAAGSSTCIMTRTGETWCFGDVPVFNAEGFLVRRAPVAPRLLSRLAGFAEVTASGTDSYCGIKNEAVLCWGDTYSFLTRDSAGANEVLHSMGVPPARQVHAGAAHACALLLDGQITCWGTSYSSVLGRKGIEPDGKVYGPAIVAGVAPAVDLVVGGTTSCALASRHPSTAQCWGRFAHDPSSPTGGSPAGQETSEPVTIRLTE